MYSIRRARAYRASLQCVVFTLALVAVPAMAQQQGGPPEVDTLDRIPGQSALQQRIGFAVEFLCKSDPTTGSDPDAPDLASRCGNLFGEGSGILSVLSEDPQNEAALAQARDLNDALRELVGDEIPSAGTALAETVSPMITDVGKRLYALRHGATGFQIAGSALPGADTETARRLREDSASGPGDGKLGGFFSANVGWGEFDGSDEERGFDFRSFGLTGGLDWRLRENFVVGAAIGWNGRDDDYDDRSGDLDADIWSGSLYATFTGDRFYVDGIVGFSRQDLELERNIAYSVTTEPDPVIRTATGDTEADQFDVSLGAGYEMAFGGLSIGPRVRFDYRTLDIDSFTEKGAMGFDLAYDDQDIDSLSSIVGVEAAWSISTSFGVITPQLRADWEHEFDNDSRNVTVRFDADPSRTRFFVRTDSPDRDFFNLGVGVAAALTNGYAVFADFETVLGLDDVDAYVITVGFRREF